MEAFEGIGSKIGIPSNENAGTIQLRNEPTLDINKTKGAG
jgi:hypothetical protein